MPTADGSAEADALVKVFAGSLPQDTSMRYALDGIVTCLYDAASFWNRPARIPTAFKPNYGRDRAERARAARAKIEEKQRRKDEKTALRKAAHAESEPPRLERSFPDESKTDASKQA